MKEMHEQYIGNRPCSLKKSNWEARVDETRVRGKNKRKNHIA